MQPISYVTEVGKAVDEMKSTKLWKRLEELNPTRADSAVKFVEIIEPFLNSIHEYFPLYTRHDCHHSYEVLNRMEDVIMDELLQDTADALTDDEILCLIVSAYAHDVGMVLFEEGDELKKLLSSLRLESVVNKQEKKITDYLRKHHAERGMKFLRRAEFNIILPEYIRGIIGKIMKGHNLHPNEISMEIPKAAAIGRKTSNPISLSIILCCADALEFSDTRVISSAYESAKQRGDADAEYSLLEMMKHKAIGCGISISNEGLITATGEFYDPKVLHATHNTLNQIEIWLKEYIYHDKLESRPVLKLSSSTIYRDSFTTDGFKYHPVAIKMDEYQIREILTSKNMWGGTESAPIKELLQNSIDACRYRNHIKPPHIDYQPQIEVCVNNIERSISVKDNGIGMTEGDITEYFLQIGKSRTRSTSFVQNPINNGFSSLARFGIGFWSVFSIAKNAKIQTKYDNFFESRVGTSFEVSVNPLRSYLSLVETDAPDGTEIKLYLKDEVDISQISQSLSRVLSVSEVPCKIINENGELLYDIPRELKRVTLEDIFGYRYREAEKKGMKLFTHCKSNDLVEVSLGISYTEIKGMNRCLTPEGLALFNLAPMGMGEGLGTSVCGLYTSYNIGSIPFAIGRVGKLMVNIKDPTGLEFSISRRQLIENDRLLQIGEDIGTIISDGLRNFYESMGVLNSPMLQQFVFNDSIKSGGNEGDSRVPGLYKHYEKNYKGLVPLEILYWTRENGKINLNFKYMMLSEFWDLKEKVYHACIWPDSDDQKKISFINAVINSVNESQGYILWAYKVANALVEIASSIKVININAGYYDWHKTRNEVIVIEPWRKFDEKDNMLVKVTSKWSGQMIAMPFDKTCCRKPWFSYGRYIMYVDAEHDLIKHLINLSNQGKLWECGEILSLMAASDNESDKEILRRTGVSPFY